MAKRWPWDSQIAVFFKKIWFTAQIKWLVYIRNDTLGWTGFTITLTHIQFRNFKRLIPYLKTLHRPSHHFPAIKKIRKKNSRSTFFITSKLGGKRFKLGVKVFTSFRNGYILMRKFHTWLNTEFYILLKNKEPCFCKFILAKLYLKNF